MLKKVKDKPIFCGLLDYLNINSINFYLSFKADNLIIECFDHQYFGVLGKSKKGNEKTSSRLKLKFFVN